MKIRLLVPALLLALSACKSQGPVATEEKKEPVTVVAVTPQEPPKTRPDWAPGDHPYHAAATRRFDLLHTTLYLRFDWKNAHVIGTAALSLKPYFYPEDTVELDAKGFDIRKVAMVEDSGEKELKYDYDGMKLRIALPRTYKRDEDFVLEIDYTAKPNESPMGGSAAIQGDKGLYFINPDNSEAGKPQQIWTQGETEANSRWFPTIDKPNERCTQSMYITVQDRFTTLSNGSLIDSKNNEDGTRTDHWEMKDPHAPYLFMMAIGEFSVVKDEWRGRPVNYYVEKEYEPYAQLVFGNTPEMIEFYSTVLGVDYPWEKYSQVVVRDFVSGAMENTTAVIHFGALQHDARSHLDNTNEDIIAHELFHHWFGDLVTCESWANLPLNESFATYGEFLWNQHKYGDFMADYGLRGDLKAYLGEAQGKREPLIRYHYENQEDMFDGHSYQKGGRVLHMLRTYTGDEAFFTSLRKYLTDNRFTAVEIDELRLAFEDVTGEDLKWFFDQWFMSPGHPELRVSYETAGSTVKVRVEQTQNLDYIPLYRLPATVAVCSGGKESRHEITFSTLDSTFSFPVAGSLDYVRFDPDRDLLAAYRETGVTREHHMAQVRHGQSYATLIEGIEGLRGYAGDDDVAEVMLGATRHEFWGVRSAALDMLSMYSGSKSEDCLSRASTLLVEDPRSYVRNAAVRLIAEHCARMQSQNPERWAELESDMLGTIRTAMNDSSYTVQNGAFNALYDLDPEAAMKIAPELEGEDNNQLKLSLAKKYMDAGSERAVPYVEKIFPSLDNDFARFQMVGPIAEYAAGLEGEPRSRLLKLLMDAAVSGGPWWMRYTVYNKLKDFDDEEVKQFIERRKQEETNDRLRDFLEGL